MILLFKRDVFALPSAVLFFLCCAELSFSGVFFFFFFNKEPYCRALNKPSVGKLFLGDAQVYYS